MMRHSCLMLVILALVSGCTAEFRPRPSIPVPPNLSQRDVEVVVLYELANQPLPPNFSNSERIADHAMKGFFGNRYQSPAPSQNIWFPESIEPGVIYAGYQKGRHYLRVAIRVDERTIIASIIDSKNLNQSEDRINEHAVIWIDQLEGRLRRALGQAAAAKNLASPLPMENRTVLSADNIPLIKSEGVYQLPVEVNGVITLNFILDTGASEVNIPGDVALTLYRTGTIREQDFLPGQTYRLADGSQVKSSRFLLQSLKMGSNRITNVPASIGEISSPLLLGQNFLERLGTWGIDRQKQVLTIGTKGELKQ